MRFILSVILIALLSAFAEHYCAWWSIAVIAFAVSLLLNTPKAFWAGFLAIGIFWLVAILLADIPNEHILSKKIAVLFHLPNYTLLITVTILIGALVGGLSALSGAVLRKMLLRK